MDTEAMRAELAGYGMSEQQLALLDRLPPRVLATMAWMMQHWPGRVILRVVTGLRRVQVFDRAMTIAAQLFTSVFPIIIMGSTLFGSDDVTSTIGSVGSLPPDTQELLDDVTATSGDAATFGLLGTLVILISATSLSRAMIRAYDAVWLHGHTGSKLNQAWRWLVAVIALAIAVVVSQKAVALLEPLPPRDWWATVAVGAVNAVVATWVPWLLLAGRVPARWLFPGGLLFAVGMLLAHPISTVYLSNALEVSAARFGAIGVAFTYLTYLYAVSWLLLATAVVGQVIVADEGPLGRFVRGRPTADRPTPTPPTLDAEPERE